MTLAVALCAAPAAHAAAILPGFDTSSLAANDDGSTGLIPFGFTIDFYGVLHTDAFLNNNGNITFDSALGTFTPFAITGGSQPMLAPFFADVDTTFAGALMTYGTGTVGSQDAFGVNWVDVDYYFGSGSHTNRDSFQLVIVDRSDIAAGDFDFMFNHDQIQWEAGEASGSDADGCGGTSAHAGWTNGAGTFLELAGSGVNGAFLDSGTCIDGFPYAGVGANALIFDHTSNTDVDGRYLYQVRNGSVVPEPASLLLLGTGIAGMAARRRLRARKP